MRLVALALTVWLGGCITVTSDPCRDGVRDGSESDIDCGGACGACGIGRTCFAGSDCGSGVCSAGNVCTTGPSCSDGIANGTESDVDCGGSCGKCNDGRNCLASSDCLSNVCDASLRCVTPATATLPDFSAAPVYLCDPGAAVILQPGSQAGFGITSNNGSSFRIVWTGDAGATGTYHEFYGSVYTAGTFVSMTPGCGGACALESGDYVSAPYSIVGGQQIDFDTIATTGLDGFDFAVSVEPVYFDLYIDGQRYPNLVFFTSSGAQSITAGEPFGLTTR